MDPEGGVTQEVAEETVVPDATLKPEQVITDIFNEVADTELDGLPDSAEIGSSAMIHEIKDGVSKIYPPGFSNEQKLAVWNMILEGHVRYSIDRGNPVNTVALLKAMTNKSYPEEALLLAATFETIERSLKHDQELVMRNGKSDEAQKIQEEMNVARGKIDKLKSAANAAKK